jgi:hypothetical protein
VGEWCGVGRGAGSVDCGMGWRCGCVDGRGVGVGVVCGVEILSIGAGVGWYSGGVVVLGDVAICVMRGMMWSGIGGSLGVLVGAVKRFLQLSKFLILFGQVFCPTKSCFHLLYLGLSGLLQSSCLPYLVCLVLISQHPCTLFTCFGIPVVSSRCCNERLPYVCGCLHTVIFC